MHTPGLPAYDCLLPLDSPVPPQIPTPYDLPPGQHEIAATLTRDAQGDPNPPRHMRGYLLEVRPERLDGEARRRLEGALRAIEETYTYGPQGVLTLVAYGQSYFDRYAPGFTVPGPRRFGATDARAVFTGAPVFLQLLSDHLVTLKAIETALFRSWTTPLRGVPARMHRAWVGDLFRVRLRTGGALFAGAPRRLLVDGGALARPLAPRTRAQISADQAFFLGFKSNFAAGNASEADVTLAQGAFSGGTFAQVSHVLEDLDAWYGRSPELRARLMFNSRHPDPTRSDPPPADQVLQECAVDHLAGHNAKAAMARWHAPDGTRRPLLLRRDYPSVDLGIPGLQFVVFIRDLADFDRMRTLMEGEFTRPLGVPVLRNGINPVLRTLRRDTFVVPPRRLRAFPHPDPNLL